MLASRKARIWVQNANRGHQYIYKSCGVRGGPHTSSNVQESSTFACEHIPGRQFRSGSYKCMCRQGFEYPFNDLTWFFDGETMEKEYDLKMLGQPSRYDLLKCRQGIGASLRASLGLVTALVLLVYSRC
ncbi:unnamed protein product [Mesocestoides corti]|uniref:Ig-like domain-containing protein n=1 Tax=Mesocestoides corti TaxID=53468 RepID=A0A0R3U7R5_MESCO|nr:unnamed protein product [Mesocestoides corti]